MVRTQSQNCIGSSSEESFTSSRPHSGIGFSKSRQVGGGQCSKEGRQVLCRLKDRQVIDWQIGTYVDRLECCMRARQVDMQLGILYVNFTVCTVHNKYRMLVVNIKVLVELLLLIRLGQNSLNLGLGVAYVNKWFLMFKTI